MKLALRTYGGIVAPIGHPIHTLDTMQLDPRDAAVVHDLVARVRRESVPSAVRRPDALSYALTIQDDWLTEELIQHDGELTPSFAQLIERLSAHGP